LLKLGASAGITLAHVLGAAQAVRVSNLIKPSPENLRLLTAKAFSPRRWLAIKPPNILDCAGQSGADHRKAAPSRFGFRPFG